MKEDCVLNFFLKRIDYRLYSLKNSIRQLYILTFRSKIKKIKDKTFFSLKNYNGKIQTIRIVRRDIERNKG